MINIVKEQKGNVLLVRLTGSIDETSNFDQLIGAPPPELHVYCKEIPRINSGGINNWVKYFQAAKSKGTKLKFFECSTAIVEQMNQISNFSAGGEVESIYVPFACTHCKSELMGLFKVAQLKKLELKVPDLKCTKCGNVAVLDEIPEEYFAFLSRS